MSVHFAADLSGIASGHDVLTRFLINPDQSGAAPYAAAAKAHMPHVIGLREGEVARIIHVSDWTIQGAVTDRFREGRIFLAGDTCKVHPPTGGLGMNSGVRDVYNLCWKLEQVLRGVSAPVLLDSHEVVPPRGTGQCRRHAGQCAEPFPHRPRAWPVG